MAQGNGYWINGRTGQYAKVTRHEQWLKDEKNLTAFGLTDLIPVLAPYNAFNPQQTDEIRMIGLRAGLIRIRDNKGTIAVQFSAPRGRVSDYLFHVLTCLEKEHEWGSQVWLNNLQYSESVVVPWQEFVKKVTAGEPCMVNEEKEPLIDDIPDDILLQRRVDALMDTLRQQLHERSCESTE